MKYKYLTLIFFIITIWAYSLREILIYSSVEGFKKGFDTVLDTLLTTVNNQQKSDTIITNIHLRDKNLDTLVISLYPENFLK